MIQMKAINPKFSEFFNLHTVIDKLEVMKPSSKTFNLKVTEYFICWPSWFWLVSRQMKVKPFKCYKWKLTGGLIFCKLSSV